MKENNLYVILADKNLGLTIVDKDWYNEHMRKHLDNKDAFDYVADWHRDQVSGPNQMKYMPFVTKAEATLRTVVNKFLPDYAVRAFMDEQWKWQDCNIPQMYGLIKLHKQPRKLRYITPVTNWANVTIAKYVASFLQPYVDSIDWILSSSMQLIPFLESWKNRSLWIGSFDVSDMYNQIDQEESLIMLKFIASAKEWWTNENENKWNFILGLIEWIYSTSFVALRNDVYKQKRELPMGSPISPAVANLFMAACELCMFNEMHEQGIDTSYVQYYRYLDNVFIGCEYDVVARLLDPLHPGKLVATDLLKFISANVVEQSVINFELTGEAWRPEEKIEYLDLKIIIRKRDDMTVLHTAVFDKPTNLHIYTDPSTFYPLHIVYSWIQGENIRYIRNSSDEISYNRQLDLFKKFLFRRKYLEQKIDRYLTLNVYEDRSKLLVGDKPHKDRKGKSKEPRRNAYIMIDNSGSRSILTNAVKVVDRVAATIPNFNIRFLSTVRKGRSILSVMNKTRH